MDNIKIVYYVFLNPNANWKAIVSGQLTQLKSYGILTTATLYIHITDCHNLLDEAKKLIDDIAPLAIISYNFENLDEYPGIDLIYNLAIKHPNDIFIYFHTKGMSHNINGRSPGEKTLFTETFMNWRENIKYLNKNGVHKVGLFPAVWQERFGKTGEDGGWIWYNFWYATGHYLTRCPKPLPKMNRYYYEGWLAKQFNDDCFIANDCKSLFKISLVNKQYFTPSEADFYLNLKIRKVNTPVLGRLQKIKSRFLIHLYFQMKILLGRNG